MIDLHLRAVQPAQTRYRFNPPRKLTAKEDLLARWIIEHGSIAVEHKAKFLGQLTLAAVVSRCPCGCASVNFAVNDIEAPKGRGLDILGDFVSEEDGERRGVFVFGVEGSLAGIEVYPLSEKSVCEELPDIRSLKPFDSARGNCP